MTSPRVYPRPCGEARPRSWAIPVRTGLSPPVRGSHRHRFSRPICGGSIPARAGKPVPCNAISGLNEVYPRPCGEAVPGNQIPRHSQGLSPPVRGSRPAGVPARVRPGSIPARAGKPRAPGRRPACSRSIPARAGKPPRRAGRSCRARVYPRPCGEASGCGTYRPTGSGLSPPVRGSRRQEDRGLRIAGSIPARAGKPMGRWRSAGVGRVYPRPCGEARRRASITTSRMGLSPPVRGSHPCELLPLRIPTDSDHRFRFIPITDSDGFRSVIPIDSDHVGVSE